MIFFEIPSGAFADLIGRKVALIIGFLAWTIGLSIYSTGTSFLTFAMAESILAFGGALMSGTDKAFIFDTLKSLGKTKEAKKIFGTSLSIMFVIAIFVNPIGSFLGSINLRLPFYLSILPFLAGTIVALTLTEPKYKKEKFSRMTYLIQIKKSIKYVKNNEYLFFLFTIMVIVNCFSTIGFWFYQPYMQLSGIGIASFGFVFAIFNVMAALS